MIFSIFLFKNRIEFCRARDRIQPGIFEWSTRWVQSMLIPVALSRKFFAGLSMVAEEEWPIGKFCIQA